MEKYEFNWFTGLSDGPLAHWLGIPSSPGHPAHLEFVVSTWVVSVLLIILGSYVGTHLQSIPGRLQSALEMAVQFVDEFAVDAIGPEGSEFTPFILSLFVFILAGSVIEIVPGFSASTSSLSTTAALAIIAFIYVNYQAIRLVGIVSFLKSFAPCPWFIMPLIIPIEIISHLVKPLTLAVRLFGNIYGEDVMILLTSGWGVSTLIATRVIPLPVQWPVVIFSLFTDILQSAVFTMLTTFYIALIVSHAHSEGHDGASVPLEPAGQELGGLTAV